MTQILVLLDPEDPREAEIRAAFDALTDEKYAFELRTEDTEELTSYPVVFACRALRDLPRFTDYAADGRCLVTVGEACTGEDPAYAALTGVALRDTLPECEVSVEIVNPEHPIMWDAADFTVREPHRLLDPAEEYCSVLAESSSEAGGFGAIAAQVRPLNGGRVIPLAVGSAPETWAEPSFRVILAGIVRYCVEGE